MKNIIIMEDYDGRTGMLIHRFTDEPQNTSCSSIEIIDDHLDCLLQFDWRPLEYYIQAGKINIGS